jgi:hypothetical protein
MMHRCVVRAHAASVHGASACVVRCGWLSGSCAGGGVAQALMSTVQVTPAPPPVASASSSGDIKALAAVGLVFGLLGFLLGAFNTLQVTLSTHRI